MTEGKPKCECWDSADSAAARELQVDGLGQAFQHSVDMAVRDLNLCTSACPYVAGAVVAGMVFWVAYMLRGDGETPTPEQVAAAELEVITLARARLEGVRNLDLDLRPAASDARH